ncbi:MAG: hypothetical protein JWN34_358 [Bryobacterales bacterium]|nr:hypothetical protein [Bryobacterales bacterium]
MPVAIPIIAAVAGAAVTSLGVGAAIGLTGLAATLASSFAGFVVSTAINAAGSSLTSKKSKPSITQNPNSVQDTFRSTVATARTVYGQTLLSGVVVFDGATSSGFDNLGTPVTGDNIFRHFVIALAGHQCEEIGTIYIEGKPVSLDADGFVIEAPYSLATSTTTQINVPVSAVASSGSGIQFTSIAPHTLVVGETVIVYVRMGKNVIPNPYTISAVPTPTTFQITNGPQVSAIETGLAPYVKRDITSGHHYIRVKKFLGSDDQTASPDLLNEISDWTSNHRLRGITCLYVRIQQAAGFNMNIQNIAALVKGKRLYDPRTGLTAWSDNAALCVRDYFTSRDGFNCDADEVNDTYTIAAANICDEVIPTTSGTQRRYTANGILDSATGMFDNLTMLLTAMVGTVTYVQGQFRIHPAAYDTPTVTITEDMLAGAISEMARPSRKDLFNAVKGTFIDPSQNYVATDFPVVTNATYETQDGGDQIIRDIELPFTNDSQAAQRLAKLQLDVFRQGITVTMPLNHSSLQCAVNDTVFVNNTRRGWNAKIFRIVKFNLAVPGPFTVTLREEAAASYDWNSGQAIVHDPAPDTSLPDPFIVALPGVPTVTEELYTTRAGGGVKAVAHVSWAPSPDRYANGYVLEYRRIEDITWIVQPKTSITGYDLQDIAPGRYEMRVKAVSYLGSESPYSLSPSLEVKALSAPPSDISGLTIQGMWGQARLSWTALGGNSDLDVVIGGRILVRHSEATSGATWENSTTIGNDTIAGNANGVVLPLKAGTYLVKAEDSTGNQSVNATTVTTKSVSLLAFSDIITVAEEPTFTGTNSNTIVDAGTLRLGGGLLFDDVADVDSIITFDFPAGVAESGTYTAASYTDLTTVQDIRLQSKITLATTNVYTLMDLRQAFIDDWLDFDGAAGGGTVDCWMEVKTTDDDPAGTPTWTDWNRVDVADVNCRAFWHRARLTSNDPAYNALVSTLQITAKQLV